MQDSEGKLELCPFRIRREQSYDNPNIFTEMFMDCLKEQCMCYSKNVYDNQDNYTQVSFENGLDFIKERKGLKT